MEIIIEDKAKEYIRKKAKDNSIKIELVEASNCWVPIVEPSVEMGKPKDISQYNVYELDDIKIYYKKEFRSMGEQIKIKLDRYLFMKYLKVDGYTII